MGRVMAGLTVGLGTSQTLKTSCIILIKLFLRRAAQIFIERIETPMKFEKIEVKKWNT